MYLRAWTGPLTSVPRRLHGQGHRALSDGPKGFFMMVEGGKIDWACHANDAAASINDTLALDAAVSEAVAFAAKHPKDTLIVVTGDHETGGMTIGFAGTQYSTFFDKIGAPEDVLPALHRRGGRALQGQDVKPEDADLADLLPAIETPSASPSISSRPSSRPTSRSPSAAAWATRNARRSIDEDQYLLYGGYEPLTVKITHILNQNAGIGWTTYSHTGVPVATFAKGSGQELFGGYYDNTDIYKKLCSVMGCNPRSDSKTIATRNSWTPCEPL